MLQIHRSELCWKDRKSKFLRGERGGRGLEGGGLRVWLQKGRLQKGGLQRGGFKGAASGPPELHTTTQELQTCTFDGPGASKHHQNSTRRSSEREEKKENCGGRWKKARNFGPLTLRAPFGPHPSGPHFLSVGPPPFEPPSFEPPTSWVHGGPTLLHPPTTTQHTQKKN